MTPKTSGNKVAIVIYYFNGESRLKSKLLSSTGSMKDVYNYWLVCFGMNETLDITGVGVESI